MSLEFDGGDGGNGGDGGAERHAAVFEVVFFVGGRSFQIERKRGGHTLARLEEMLLLVIVSETVPGQSDRFPALHVGQRLAAEGGAAGEWIGEEEKLCDNFFSFYFLILFFLI